MKLKALLLTAILSTTLFAGFSTVNCDLQSDLNILHVTQGDCKAMEAFWDATGQGDGWKYKTGWDELRSAEEWFGITLWESGQGIKWFLPYNNNITGVIPDGISQLTNAQTIGISNNYFSGIVPNTINNIPSLISFSVADNGYIGKLPKIIINNLEYIYFNRNNYSGTIPSEYSQLTKLKVFSFYSNKLSGPLPDMSQMSQLEDVRFQFNRFTFADIEPQAPYLSTVSKTLAFSGQADINETGHVVYFDDTLRIEPNLAVNPSGHDRYSWKKRGVKIEGWNGSRIYIKTEATPADAGDYSYFVTNTVLSNFKYSSGTKTAGAMFLKNNTDIKAIYDNTPTVTNQTPSEVVTEGETYTYTSMISDEDSEDNNSLVVQENTLPNWLTLTSTGSEFTLSGLAPALFGLYDINITVTDNKIPVHINYKLRVDPKTLPAGFTLSHGIYTHTATGKSINSDTFVTFENEGVAVTGTCLNNKKPYTSIDSSGKLTTGYKNCNTTEVTNTFTTELPNNTKASIVTNNNEKMILIEIPLTQDITLQGN